MDPIFSKISPYRRWDHFLRAGKDYDVKTCGAVESLPKIAIETYYILGGTDIFYSLNLWASRFPKRVLKSLKYCKKELCISDDELHDLLAECMGALPIFHFFTPEECADIVLLEMGGNTRATAEICKGAEKRFKRKHPIVYFRAAKKRKERQKGSGFTVLY